MSKKQRSLKQLITVVLTALMLTLTLTPAFAKANTKMPVLNASKAQLVIGKSFDFNVKNKAKNVKYQWISSNEKVATVDANGIVTGISKGKTTITCRVKLSGYYVRVNASVTVYKPAVIVSISNPIETIKVGESYDLDADKTPASSNDKLTWTSSDKSIANPEFNGYFKALKAGTVTITCTSVSGRSDSVTIKVIN